MSNNTLIERVNVIINSTPETHSYKFPLVNARYMIDFERAYSNNYHHPVIVMVRHDIKDSHNHRTYYLYEKDHKIYKVYVIKINDITKTYAEPYTRQISTIQ
jgi:hypothetical protein